MPYRLTNEARNDLIILTIYGVERFGQAQAHKYLAGLYHTFEMLSDMSGLGRRVPELGAQIRRFEHGRHSIFYIAKGDHVEIGRIIDNRRDMRELIRPGEE